MLCNKIKINKSERFVQTIETKINEPERFTQTQLIIHIFAFLSDNYIKKKKHSEDSATNIYIEF